MQYSTIAVYNISTDDNVWNRLHETKTFLLPKYFKICQYCLQVLCVLRWEFFFTGWYMSYAIYFNLPEVPSGLRVFGASLLTRKEKGGKGMESTKAKNRGRALRFQRSRTLRLSEREDARLVEHAAIAGLSVSEYMRRLFFGGRPIIASTDAQMIRELRRMGGLLKHLSGTNPEAAAEMGETLTSIRQAIDRIAERA